MFGAVSRPLLVAAALAFALAGCGAGGTTSAPAATATSQPTDTPSPTADVAAVASAALLAAYNSLGTTDTTLIAKQNSQDAATSTLGINARVANHQVFDQALAAITFPASAQADERATLNADTALEQGLGTLAVNRADVTNYNAVFDTVQPMEAAFTSAAKALATDLGLTVQ